MSAPIIKSRRQHLRLWFEFYKLCHRDDVGGKALRVRAGKGKRLDFRPNLKKSAEFYAPWGDVRSVKFDAWWKDHQHLFGETLVQEVSAVTPHPDVMHLAVPLNQTVSKSLEQIEGLIKAKQTNRLKDRGIDPTAVKSKNIGFGRYELTRGVEIRGATLNDILMTLTTWIDLGQPAVGTKFLSKLREVFEERPISTYIPYVLTLKPQKNADGELEFDEVQIRLVRRYIKKGIEVCRSVSSGDFPGKSRLK
jgi:hypothetical protein